MTSHPAPDGWRPAGLPPRNTPVAAAPPLSDTGRRRDAAREIRATAKELSMLIEQPQFSEEHATRVVQLVYLLFLAAHRAAGHHLTTLSLVPSELPSELRALAAELDEYLDGQKIRR